MTPDIRAMMRYRNALSAWYARMMAAARRHETFTERKPEPQDFKPSRPWSL